MASHVRNLYFWQRHKVHYNPGSVILITGAGSGIGENVSYQYAKRDSKLVLVDFNQEALNKVEKACNKIKGNSSSVITILVDVTKLEQCQSMIETTIKQFHRLDILVLCAGIGAHHLFESTKDLSIFRKLMEVNFYGYLHCLSVCYKYLIDSKGLVIAITSFSGEVGLPYRTAYCASKFAVTGLLESLRSEMTVLQSEGKLTNSFDITIVCPPTINTNLRKNSLTPDPALKEAASPNALSVEECASAVVDAGDRRLRKAFFPLKSWLASYLRPIVPDIMDSLILARAKL